jgi:leucyl-tRNA synthetase
MAVQVNGKMRGTIDLPRDSAEREVQDAALALPQVARFLEGRVPRKVVVVPNRIVSVVA